MKIKYIDRINKFYKFLELHPEAFPDPERKKFKDIFVRWPPIR